MQQGAKYHWGNYIAAESDAEFHEGIVLMIVGLKQYVPLVVRAVGET